MNNLKQFSEKLMALQGIIDSDKALIEAYCKEIIPNSPTMTLEKLIESHRSLRETNRAYHHQWLEELGAAVDKRVEMRINDRYVLWSDLEKMTLAEIVERIL